MGQELSRPGLWYAWKQDEKYVEVQWLPSNGEIEEEEINIKTASKAFVATAGDIRISGILGGFAEGDRTHFNARKIHRVVDPRKGHVGGSDVAGQFMEDVGDYHHLEAKSSVLDFGRRLLHDDDDGVLQEMQIVQIRLKKQDRGEVWEHLFITEGSAAGLDTGALPDHLEDDMTAEFAEHAKQLKQQIEEENLATRRAAMAALKAQEEAAANAAASEAAKQMAILDRKREEERLAKMGFFSKYWLSIIVAIITILVALNILFR